jgi:multiple sugar transport system substrate-binding protein
MRDMVFARRVSPSPAQVASNLYSFEAGNVGMYIDFAGLAPRYRDLVQDFHWDIVPTPSDPDQPYTMTKGNQIIISQQCQHPREAWEWIKYMTSRETELFICGDAYRRSIPTRLAVLRDPQYLDAKLRPYHADVFANLLDHPRQLPIDESWYTWTTTATRFMEQLYVNNSVNTQEVMTAAAKAVDRELAREHERYRRFSETGFAHAQ